MNITPQKLQRLQECVNVLDQAASVARVDRQSHVTAQIAVSELRDLINELAQPRVVPDGKPAESEPSAPAQAGG